MIHSKDSQVFLVQVDHLSGEQIGRSVDRFYRCGASNVQILSGVTKKNRPSWVILIDCRPEYREEIQKCIVDELNVGGWHEIKTIHYYFHDKKIRRPIKVVLKGSGVSFDAEIEGKRFESGTVRPEHDGVSALQEAINTNYHEFVPYNILYHLIAAALLNDDQEEIVIS